MYRLATVYSDADGRTLIDRRHYGAVRPANKTNINFVRLYMRHAYNTSYKRKHKEKC